MTEISKQASAETSTCWVRTTGGRLPDLDTLARSLAGLQLGVSLRGVEADVSGWLAFENGELLLRISGTGEAVRLAPLRRKVQWNARKKQDWPATEEERRAFERLRSLPAEQCPPVRIVGPLAAAEGAARYMLQVRSFTFSGRERQREQKARGAGPSARSDNAVKRRTR